MLLVKKTNIILASLLLLAGCAELNDSLAKVNSALSGVNGSLSGSTSSEGNRIPDRQTPVYTLKNMKIIPTASGLELTGEAYNKINKMIRLTLSVPIYDKEGFASGSLRGEVVISAKEKTRIEIHSLLPVPEGGRYDIQKFKVQQEIF